jgi:uncharacterized membrane protein YhaH (DUF805 family)
LYSVGKFQLLDIEQDLFWVPSTQKETMSSPVTAAPTMSPAEHATFLGVFVFLLFAMCFPFFLHLFAFKKGCFDEYMLCIKEKTKEFRGRSRRKEYIGFIVANWLLSYDMMFIDHRLGTTFGENNNFGVFWLLYLVLTFVPTLAVSIRRLHDTGRSGAWLFAVLIPFVGYLAVNVILIFFDSEVGDNKWGANPKNVVFDAPTATAEYVAVHEAETVGRAASDDNGDAPLLEQSFSSSKTIEPSRPLHGDSRGDLV